MLKRHVSFDKLIVAGVYLVLIYRGEVGSGWLSILLREVEHVSFVPVLNAVLLGTESRELYTLSADIAIEALVEEVKRPLLPV